MIRKNSIKHYLKHYSQLNVQDITDADYAHAKSVCKDFNLKYFGDYHDLYV